MRIRQTHGLEMCRVLARSEDMRGVVVLCMHILVITSTCSMNEVGKSCNTGEINNFSWRLMQSSGDIGQHMDESRQDFCQEL